MTLTIEQRIRKAASVLRYSDNKSEHWVTMEPSGTHVELDGSGNVTKGPDIRRAKKKEAATPVTPAAPSWFRQGRKPTPQEIVQQLREAAKATPPSPGRSKAMESQRASQMTPEEKLAKGHLSKAAYENQKKYPPSGSEPANPRAQTQQPPQEISNRQKSFQAAFGDDTPMPRSQVTPDGWNGQHPEKPPELPANPPAKPPEQKKSGVDTLLEARRLKSTAKGSSDNSQRTALEQKAQSAFRKALGLTDATASAIGDFEARLKKGIANYSRLKSAAGQMDLFTGMERSKPVTQARLDWDESKVHRAENGEFATKDGEKAADKPDEHGEPNEPADTTEPTSTDADSDAEDSFELSSETPREAAERQQKLDADYEFARQSSVPNAGEDLKGSARHKRNMWKGLDAAEENGTAEDMVTRDNLLKSEPHELVSIADDSPLSALVGYYALRAFPAKPGFGNEKQLARRDEETKKKDRKQFVETYQEFKNHIESLAKIGLDADSMIDVLKDWTAKKISDLRGVPKDQRGTYLERAGVAGTDRYNNTANALVSTLNDLAQNRKKTGVSSKLNAFLSELTDKYESADDLSENTAEHVKDIIEGRSLPQTFGKKGEKSKGASGGGKIPSTLEQIEDEQHEREQRSKPKAGQKDMFSRRFEAAARRALYGKAYGWVTVHDDVHLPLGPDGRIEKPDGKTKDSIDSPPNTASIMSGSGSERGKTKEQHEGGGKVDAKPLTHHELAVGVSEILNRDDDTAGKVVTHKDGTVRVYLKLNKGGKRGWEEAGEATILADGSLALNKEFEHALRYSPEVLNEIRSLPSASEAKPRPAAEPQIDRNHPDYDDPLNRMRREHERNIARDPLEGG